MTAKNFCPVELIGRPGGLPVAANFNQPGSGDKVVARCLNTTEQSTKLRSGSMIGVFTGVEEDQVDDMLGAGGGKTVIGVTSARVDMVPRHLQQLYNAVRESCSRVEEYHYKSREE